MFYHFHRQLKTLKTAKMSFSRLPVKLFLTYLGYRLKQTENQVIEVTIIKNLQHLILHVSEHFNFDSLEPSLWIQNESKLLINCFCLLSNPMDKLAH